MEEIISIAPGRTCLFGDHQDYLGLPIIACAINKHITLKAVKNNSDFLKIDLPDINQKREINIYNKDFVVNKGDFFLSTLNVLKRYKCTPNTGYDIKITGTIPINSGTSSSSALVIAWAQFLIKIFGPEHLLTPEKISQIAFESEVLEFNASGGKMDQYSIGLGNIIYLETGDNFSYEVLKAPNIKIIMADSGVPKDTEGLLNKLKTNSWKAINEVKNYFPDFTIENSKSKNLDEYLKVLPSELKPYLEAAIGNYQVTKKALLEFKKDKIDIEVIGDLMNQHHCFLKNYLKITVPKIDLMIDAAIKNGALGAKIVGSGGGGSIVALATNKNEQKIMNAILEAGAKNVYIASIEKGASIK